MSETGPSTISIVVAVHDSRSTLAPALAALAQLDDSNYEVVVVDDGSSDGSLDIARAWCQRPGAQLVELPCNKGQAVARNEGARRAKGAVLAFVDADVVVPRDWLSKYRALLAAHPEVDGFCSGYVVSDGEPPAALFASHEAFFRRLNLRSSDLTTTTSANCVLRRPAFDEVGGFPEYYVNNRRDTATQKAAAANEDSELGYLIARNGRALRWTHGNLVRHRFRQTWRGYLRQQLSFARSGTLSVFRFPGILFADDLYSGERIVPQLLVAGLMLAAVALVALGWPGLIAAGAVELAGLAFFAVYHARFFRYLGANMGDYGRARVYFWMVVARFVWVEGVVLGAIDGVCMRATRPRGRAP